MTTTSDTLDKNYHGPNANKAQLYVDANKGNNSFTGLTWRQAKKTIAAAVAAAPNGATIVLASHQRHDVGAGVSWAPGKLLRVVAQRPTSGRQLDNYTTGSTTVYSSATAKPSYFFRLTQQSSNEYGAWFEGITFDAITLADNGACVEMHAINRGRMVDCMATRNDGAWKGQYLIRIDDAGGDDASWWVVRENTTKCVGLVTATGTTGGVAGSGSFNYWLFTDNSLIGPDGALGTSTAIKMNGWSQPSLIQNHFERWAVGIDLSNMRQPTIHAPVGESVDLMVKLTDCSDISVIADGSGGGDGWSKIQCNGATTGTIIGSSHVEGTATGVKIMSDRSNSFSVGTLPANFGRTLYGPNTAYPWSGGPDLPPVGVQDLGLISGWSVDYWNGTAWTSWYALDSAATNKLLVDDRSAIVMDATHKRIRIRSGGDFYGTALGLIRVRLDGYISNNDANKVTIRGLDGSNNVIAGTAKRMPYSTASTEVSNMLRGVEGVLAANGGAGISKAEIEIDLNITGSETIDVRRVLWAGVLTDIDANLQGRTLHGRVNPNTAAITGNSGDIYHCHANTADGGMWGRSGYGTTGWVKLS